MDYRQKYLKYKFKYLSLKNTTTNQKGGSKPEIMLFKATWCPHCTNFLPTWEKIQQNLKNKYLFTTYDSELNKDKIDQWKVTGFPTLMIKNGENVEEYAGSRDYDVLLKYLSSLN